MLKEKGVSFTFRKLHSASLNQEAQMYQVSLSSDEQDSEEDITIKISGTESPISVRFLSIFFFLNTASPVFKCLKIKYLVQKRYVSSVYIQCREGHLQRVLQPTLSLMSKTAVEGAEIAQKFFRAQCIASFFGASGAQAL